jgi:thiamine-phosphate pyrophosphorylase
LSPVFDSKTKGNYQSNFKEYNLTSSIQRSNYNVVALGGVDSENINKAFNMGFWGCAFLSTLWENKNPVEKFEELKLICEELKYNPIL